MKERLRNGAALRPQGVASYVYSYGKNAVPDKPGERDEDLIPNVGEFDAAKGGGFKETVDYVLRAHSSDTLDQIAAGQSALVNTDRVAGMWFYNITGIDTPHAAAAAMQDVAARANELKRAAGISNRGRKATVSPVWHASFRGEESDPPLSDDEWLDGIMGALKALDLPDGHQIMMVKHIEPSRPHWPDFHVIVNKVNAKNGTRWNPNNDYQKLQSYCHDWDRRRGLNHCPDRAAYIEAVRGWAALEPDPKKRDRSQTIAPENERKGSSLAGRKAYDIVVAENLEVPRRFVQAADEMQQWERDEFIRLNALDRAVKSDKYQQISQSWQMLKEDQKLARRGSMGRQIWEVVTEGLDKQKVAKNWERNRGRQKKRYRTFYSREKTLSGQLLNSLTLARELKSAGLMTTQSFLTLSINPTLRKNAMAALSNYDRQKVKAENKSLRVDRYRNSHRRKQVEAAFDAHRARVSTIEAESTRQEKIAKFERSTFYQKSWDEWGDWIDELRRHNEDKRLDLENGVYQDDDLTEYELMDLNGAFSRARIQENGR